MKQETIDRIRKFVSDRAWEPYHTPANLAKSISIEANELLECFQWSDTEYDLEHVKEELADVLVYCRKLPENEEPAAIIIQIQIPSVSDGFQRGFCLFPKI